MQSSRAHAEIQPDEHAFRVREVADDLLDRFGQPSHERGHGQDLVAARELRILQQIDDLDLVAPLQMLLADLLQVREGQDRLRRLSGDVEPQLIGLASGDGVAPSFSDSCMAIPSSADVLDVRRPCGAPAVAAHVQPVIGQHELAQLVRVRHAARLEHVQPAAVATADVVVRQHDPRVHQRRDGRLGPLDVGLPGREARQHRP